MKFYRRLSLCIVAVMLLATILSGCGETTNETGSKTDTEKGTEANAGADSEVKSEIIIAQANDIKSLDPHATNDSASSNVNRQIYGSLIRTDKNMDIVGDLAVEWEPISPTEWQFKLREGVKWHDGTDFTSEDVEFSIMRQKESARVKHLVEPITEIKIIDEHTVILVTDKPFGPILPNLAHSASRIVSKKAVTEYGDKYADNPVGTGAFKFVEWKPGDQVVLERFDDFYEGKPPAEKLIFRSIPEGPSRTIALETGEVDLVIGVEPSDKKRVEENEDLTLYEKMSNRTEYLGFHVEKKPFDNKLVRQAINHAIYKPAIIDVASDGRGEVAHTVIGKKVLGFNPDVPEYEYDIEKAKELLAEAGYPDGFSTTLWASGDVRNRIAQIIQANLSEIGIQIEVELLEWGAYLDRTKAGEHDMFLLGWTNLTADGDGGMYPLFHSSKKGAGGNRAFYENSEVDKLLEAGREETDFAKRPEPYKKAQLLIMEDAPWVPLYYMPVDLGARKDLKGVELHPGSMHRYHMLHY